MAQTPRHGPMRHKRRVYPLVKRLLDVVLSIAGLVLFAPLMLAAAFLIRRDSPGPALFLQQRVGLHGKLFRIVKFRTMYTHVSPSVATSELRNPLACITRVGRVLRKSSIDELPQLFNVLRGEMSLIGPRPLVPEEKDIHGFRMAAGAYDVLPGVTGWAQVNGRDCVDARTKADLDGYYATHVSLGLDLLILLYSVLCVVTARGIQEGGGEPDDTPEEAPKARNERIS